MAAFSGIMMVLSYPPFQFYLLAFIAFVPLLWAIELKEGRPYLLVYTAMVIYSIGTNWWIGSWQEDTDSFLYIAGIAVSLGQPLFFLVPFFIYRFIRKRLGLGNALWLFPLIWTSFEWLRSFGDFSFTWLTLGHTQIYNYYWVQIADVAGVWGISFLIISFNILILKMTFRLRDRKPEKYFSIKIFKIPGILKYTILMTAIIAGPYIYGRVNIDKYDHDYLLATCSTIKAGIIQPNINPWKKWEVSAIDQIRIHQHIQDSLLKADGPLDACFWSETAITHLNSDFNIRHHFSFLKDWVDQSGAALLTGFVDRTLIDRSENMPVTAKPYTRDSSVYILSYNSALMLSPDADSGQIYHKMELTPFSERLPYLEVFHFALGWLEWGVGISSWTMGDEQKNLSFALDSERVNIAPIICIESIYPNFVRHFVIKGAEALAVITNDAWFDYTYGPEQHYLIAAMRAIECRRYLIRSANTGISGFIKPDGQTLKVLPQYTQAGASAEIPLMKYESLYLIFGDWLAIISIAMTIIGFIYSFLYKKFPVYKGRKNKAEL